MRVKLVSIRRGKSTTTTAKRSMSFLSVFASSLHLSQTHVNKLLSVLHCRPRREGGNIVAREIKERKKELL